MPGGVGGARASLASTRFDAAAGENDRAGASAGHRFQAGGNQASRLDRAAPAPPADPTATPTHTADAECRRCDRQVRNGRDDRSREMRSCAQRVRRVPAFPRRLAATTCPWFERNAGAAGGGGMSGAPMTPGCRWIGSAPAELSPGDRCPAPANGETTWRAQLSLPSGSRSSSTRARARLKRHRGWTPARARHELGRRICVSGPGSTTPGAGC